VGAEGYRHAGDIDVESVTMVMGDGSTLDIQNLVREINVYQNLFKHYIEAEFVMDDSVGIFASGSTGSEVVEVSFRNAVGPGVEKEYTRHIFMVYEISDRKRISEQREAYIMNGISIESYQAIPHKISRAYGPDLISEFVMKIKDEFLYNDFAKDYYTELGNVFGYILDKDSDTVFDVTEGEQQIIIPNMPVDDAIDFLSSEADSDDHIPFFTFYEDTNGFNFRNLSKLAEQEPVATYHHLPQQTREPTVSEESFIEFDDTYKIVSFDIVKQSNILENTTGGLYKHKTVNLDMHRRKKHEVIYDYDEYQDMFIPIENKILGGSEGNPIVTLITSRKNHDIDPTLADENHLPKRINETVSVKKGYQNQLFNFIMEVVVHGNADLKVGDKIELMFYHTAGDEVNFENYDKYLSGYFLITKLRQKISGGKSGKPFASVIECVKDGIREG